MEPMSESPTIFLIDPDPSVRSVVSLIAAQMGAHFVHYATAESFLGEYSQGTSGCIITEFRLLGICGSEFQICLADRGISLPVIFVTAHAEVSVAVHAMQLGAITVLEKPISEQALWVSTRRAISHDREYRRIDAGHKIVRKRLSKLTTKERAVLDLLIEGRTNKNIARELDLSVRTVEARRHLVFKKTGTHSIAELVRLILNKEVNDPDGP